MPTDTLQEQFTQLWTEAQPMVADYLHAVVRDRTAAKDLLQETALVLLRKFHEYDPARPFLGWALGIARYQALGSRRDAARALVTSDSELLERFTETWVEVAPAISDEAVALENCVDRLAQRARSVLHLRYFEGLTSHEIAGRLQSSAGAIRVLLQRVREKLRGCVERELRQGGNRA